MCAYRDNFEIITAILKAAEAGAGIAKIMRDANLNHEMVVRYLKIAFDAMLVELNEASFKTTDRGKSYLKSFSCIQDLKLKIVAENQVLAQLLLNEEKSVDKKNSKNRMKV